MNDTDSIAAASSSEGSSASPSSAPPGAPATPSSATPPTSPPPKPQWGTNLVFKQPFPEEFATKVRELETLLKRQVLLLVEGNERGFLAFYPSAWHLLRAEFCCLPSSPVAVLLDSAGGSGKTAYRIAKLLRRRCGSYVVLIPRLAKSAATLFSLGADQIILGEEAELGPLDAQIWDPDVEEDMVSALDTVQAVEQLEDSAIEVAIKMLRYLNQRTRKKYNLLLRHSLKFSAEITQPLFNKIDAVRYSRQHRMLKEAQDYAERLLQPKFSQEQAAAIAKDLVRRYSTHDFLIDRDESKQIGTIYDKETEEEIEKIGLHVADEVPSDLETLLNWFSHNINRVWCAGFIKEIVP